jgi:hypothetical protein
MRLYLEKPFTKIGLVEWLRVQAPVLQKKKKKNTVQRPAVLLGGHEDFLGGRQVDAPKSKGSLPLPPPALTPPSFCQSP